MKDFDSLQAERHAGVDPNSLTFRLGGMEMERLVSFSPYVLAEFQAKENPTMGETIEALRQMLHPKCHDKFDKALKEGQPTPTLDTLMELLRWLVEEATNRPTSRQSSSSDGRNGTGTPSTDDSPSVAVSTFAG